MKFTGKSKKVIERMHKEALTMNKVKDALSSAGLVDNEIMKVYKHLSKVSKSPRDLTATKLTNALHAAGIKEPQIKKILQKLPELRESVQKESVDISKLEKKLQSMDAVFNRRDIDEFIGELKFHAKGGKVDDSTFMNVAKNILSPAQFRKIKSKNFK